MLIPPVFQPPKDDGNDLVAEARMLEFGQVITQDFQTQMAAFHNLQERISNTTVPQAVQFCDKLGISYRHAQKAAQKAQMLRTYFRKWGPTPTSSSNFEDVLVSVFPKATYIGMAFGCRCYSSISGIVHYVKEAGLQSEYIIPITSTKQGGYVYADGYYSSKIVYQCTIDVGTQTDADMWSNAEKEEPPSPELEGALPPTLAAAPAQTAPTLMHSADPHPIAQFDPWDSVNSSAPDPTLSCTGPTVVPDQGSWNYDTAFTCGYCGKVKNYRDFVNNSQKMVVHGPRKCRSCHSRLG